MALIRYRREPGEGLSPEQIQEIEEAKNMPIVYDEDSPETLVQTYLSEEAEDENLDEERLIQARKAAQTEKSYDDDEVWDILGV